MVRVARHTWVNLKTATLLSTEGEPLIWIPSRGFTVESKYLAALKARLTAPDWILLKKKMPGPTCARSACGIPRRIQQTECYWARHREMFRVEAIVASALYIDHTKPRWTKLRNRFLTELPSGRMNMDQAVAHLTARLNVEEPDMVMDPWLKLFIIRMLQAEAEVVRDLAEDEIRRADAMLAAIPPGSDMSIVW